MNPEVLELTRVFYHGNKCPDGLCASWILWRHFRDLFEAKKFRIEGMVHGNVPPPVIGDVVAILDYCFPLKDILRMSKEAKKIYILDHHASTQKDLFPEGGAPLPENVITIFDNSRSGSEITWDWVYPGIPRPWFLEVISDRDLFRWKRPYSKIVANALYTHKYYTWENIESLFEKSTSSTEIEKLIKDFCILGSSLEDSASIAIDSACSSAFTAEMTTPKGEKYKVKLAQCPRVYKSEVGNKLSQKGCDFAVLYQYDFMLDEWWMSCRASDECQIDISQVCSQFKRGGGHAKAASFTIFGSTGDCLQNYFKILSVPPSRSDDMVLLKAMGGKEGKYNHVKILDPMKY